MYFCVAVNNSVHLLLIRRLGLCLQIVFYRPKMSVFLFYFRENCSATSFERLMLTRVSVFVFEVSV